MKFQIGLTNQAKVSFVVSQFPGSLRTFDSKMADRQKLRAAKYGNGSDLSLEDKNSI